MHSGNTRGLGRFFWGGLFILGAVGMVLNQAGYALWGGLSLWQICLLVFLLIILIKSMQKLSWAGIFFTLAGMGIIFAEQLGIQNYVPGTILGVALLLSIGFSILFARKGKPWFLKVEIGGKEIINV